MDVLECLTNRKSTKSFEADRMPDDADILAIAQAACNAPSGMNLQDWHFTVVTNREWLKAVTKKLGIFLGRGEDYCCYYDAPVLIIASGGNHHTSANNCACALENMFLAATALGLGSCWINQLGGSNDKHIRSELTAAGVPESDTVYGCCAVGYASENNNREKPVRKPDCIRFYK